MGPAQTQSNDRHAVVFGCSGINGWALVNQLLSDPSAKSFSKITAIANRPFTANAARWPQDSRLQIVSGIDLLARNDETLQKSLSGKVSSVETVSHVYYAGNHTFYHVIIVPIRSIEFQIDDQ